MGTIIRMLDRNKSENVLYKINICFYRLYESVSVYITLTLAGCKLSNFIPRPSGSF